MTVGELVDFTISGDLTIRDVTNEVTFNVEATLIPETKLAGTAGTTFFRGDYGLAIPNVSNAADVEEVEIVVGFVGEVG